MPAILRTILLLTILSFLTLTATATTYYVDLCGSDDANGLSWATAFATIEKGVDTSSNGDVVEVNEGTYYESIYADKNITIRSIDPYDWDIVSATVIDGNGAANTFSMGFGYGCTLQGFTITGGTNGVYFCGASPLIAANCIIRNNSQRGVYAIGCNGNVENCIIKDNGNNGIRMGSATLSAKNSISSGNNIGIRIDSSCSATIHNCTIVDNTSCGVKVNSPSASADIKNCILWNNNDDLYDCSATYSCVSDGNSGTGNISSYPYFADYDANDFHLTWNSPCINRGDPNGTYTGQTDIDSEQRVAEENYVDERVDMGADERGPGCTNLVANPGFELGGGGLDPNGDESEDVPLYWQYILDYGSHLIDPCEFHSEANSWRFSDNYYSYLGGRSDFISVRPDWAYKLSAWLKSEDGAEPVMFGWIEYDAGKEQIISRHFVSEKEIVPQSWTLFEAKQMPLSRKTRYVRVDVQGPYEYKSDGKLWLDDFNLVEAGTEFLAPYGWYNQAGFSEAIDFGGAEANISWIEDINSLSDKATDSNDNNITYRELLADKTLTIGFPSFNLDAGYDPNDPNDMNSLPLTPMLLEIMFKDTINISQEGTDVLVYSKIDYIDLDSEYLIEDANRNHRIIHLGEVNDSHWKYVQYGFQKSDYQLIRAINNKFTITIKNTGDINLPIDYISLRKITSEEYDALVDKQRTMRDFCEVNLPADEPSPLADYNDLTVFVRDTMRPVYQHTKPQENEIDANIVGFSGWGEVEPLSFSIYSINGLNDVSVEVSNLTCVEDANDAIDANNISVHHVIYDETRLEYIGWANSGVNYALQPDRIESFSSLSITPDTTERFWLKIEVPDASENLSAGLYEGNVYIKKNGITQRILPIKLTIYNFTLNESDHTDFVYVDPYTQIYSRDLDEMLKAYAETGLEQFTWRTEYNLWKDDWAGQDHPYRIYAYDDGGTIAFDSDSYETSLDRMIEAGCVKNQVSESILGTLLAEVYKIATSKDLTYNPNLYYDLSDANFVDAFESLLDKYAEIGNERNIQFIFHALDEPGVYPLRRIICDRLYTIIKNHNSLTGVTYYKNCDEPCPPGSFNVPGGYIQPLTDLVDYKYWLMTDVGEGYKRHNDPCDPNHPTIEDHLCYYTTGHSHYRNPVYNRFLHGLFAFGTDANCTGAFHMSNFGGDMYNDLDAEATMIFPFTYPDFIYAYPTWSGKLLYTIGGLEGIREGIKDAKYIAKLKSLIAEDPNNSVALSAQGYLDDVKSRIDPNYTIAYSSQSTDLGYYPAILEDISESSDPNDFEAFTGIRKDVAEYIVLLSSLASEPNPADGAEDVNIATSLSWTPGKCALSYDVYLGTDYDDVNDANTSSPQYMGNYDVNTFEPNTLGYSITYYWRIDGISAVGTAKGSVWSFTTELYSEPNLISLWKFDVGSGNVAYDSTGSNDGNINGATWTSGQIDGALDFDGNNDNVDCGNPSEFNFGEGNFSISFWLKTNKDTGEFPIWKNGYNSASGYCFYKSSAGTIGFELGDGTHRSYVYSTTSVEDDEWHHVVGMTNGANVLIWVDGEDWTGVDTTGNCDISTHFYIGRGNSSNYDFIGTIDDVRVYDRALTEDEVEALYLMGN